MAHKHKHSHNLEQEVFVAKIFWLVIILYFLLQLFLEMNSHGLLGGEVAGGWLSTFWLVLTDVWQYRLGPVFIGLNIVLLLVMTYSIIKVWPIRQKISIFSNPHAHAHGPAHAASPGQPAAPAHNPAILKHWTDIVKRANTGTPENLRWAIMEADALVDMVLKQRQTAGDTMADRLANFRREDYKTVDKLWDAHRLRNDIAHTPGFKLSSRQAEKALLGFRDFLKELKAF